MLFVFILLVLNLYYALKTEVLSVDKTIYINRYFLINLVIISLLFLLHLIELWVFNNKSLLLQPDEIFFYNEASSQTIRDTLHHLLERYGLFILIDQLLLVFGNTLILKLFNIFFLTLFIMFLYKKYNNFLILKYFPVFLPFMYFLAFQNLRDIITILIFFILMHLSSQKLRFPILLKIVALSLLLWSLRPQWFMVLIAIFFITKFAISTFKYKFIYLILSFIALIFSYAYLTGQLSGIIWSIKATSERRMELLNVRVKSGLLAYLIGIFKQIFTPLPTSKIAQIFSSDRSSNLYLIEISRIVMQTGLYFLIIYMLIHIKSFVKFVKENQYNLMLFWAAVINTILYGIYRMGSGGSRNKLFPVILLFLFFCDYIVKKQDRESI